MQITCRNYDLEETGESGANVNKEENDFRLPFQSSDIVEVNPLVKHLDIVSDDVQANMEIVIINFYIKFCLIKKKKQAQKFLLEGKVKEALEAFQNSIQLLLNVYCHFFMIINF